ncbi:acyltransferase [Colwelliaceae bacterium BS250]
MTSKSLDFISREKFGERQHFLDWVRILAFAFLVFYHTGMMFVDWGFHIESGHNSTFLKSIMILSSKWRLDILFLVSGVAISVMITKMSMKQFIWQRLIKLYLPLLFAIAVVVAPQSYFEAIQKGIFDGSYYQFWTSLYFTLSWDERMIAPFPTYNHMWYVLYLFHYSVVLIPLFILINSNIGVKSLQLAEGWLSKGTRVIWLPFVIYLAIYLAFDNHNVTHAFFDDWYAHSIFMFAVIMGVVFVRMPSVWQSFEDNRHLSLILGLMSYSMLLAVFLIPKELLPISGNLPWDMAGLMVKWSWISLIIGYARKHLNYSNGIVKYCNGVVYPFFILHQTVTIIIGFFIIDWGFSGVVEFLLIVFGTFLICAMIIELVIKRFNILRVLFGLNWQQNTKNKRQVKQSLVQE